MPARRMSYVTVASVGEVTLTAVTLADADFARPDRAWASITAANFCPFCSREIFFAAEVVPLKNASQFALIWAAALESPADAGAETRRTPVQTTMEPSSSRLNCWSYYKR